MPDPFLQDLDEFGQPAEKCPLCNGYMCRDGCEDCGFEWSDDNPG